MSYYAVAGRVTQRPLEGAIEISAEQYQAALAGISQGHVVTIDGGFAVGPKLEPEKPEPEPPTLEELAEQKRRKIDGDSVAALADVRADYPDYEQLSWERQEREARDGGGPLIQAIADARGLSLEDLISRIIAKADAYQEAAGIVIGRRQALHDQISAIEADEDIIDDEKRKELEKISWT